MKKPLFEHGTNGKFGKPTDWRGWFLVVLPIFIVFFGLFMRNTTGNNNYRLIEIIGVIFAVSLFYYMQKHSRS